MSNETLYARAEKAAEYMTPVDLVGYIDLAPIKSSSEGERLLFTIDNCEQLDKARTSHSMVYLHPYIYVIGGIVDNIPTHTCKKFNVIDGVWHNVASIGFYGTLSSPAVVGYDKYILVFDCYSEQQAIHKYQVDFDIWENIAFNTPGFRIPKSLNSMAFK